MTSSRRQKPLFLVSCVSVKNSRPMKARELYCSDWFLKAKAYVEAHGAPWFILSAKYGLVEPNQMIRPYNITLKNMTKAQRLAWSLRVAKKLKPRCRGFSRVIFLAGQSYREHLVGMLNEWGYEARSPMRGLGIGQQLRWLKRKTPSMFERQSLKRNAG